MEATLPDLLEALGEVFLVPGARCPLLEAPWAPPALRRGLEAMACAPDADLDVAYAGIFLAGFGRPALHLELSAFRTGLLCDEEVLRQLEGIFDAAGIHPEPGVPADHLGVLLVLQGHLLRRAAEPGLPARALFLDHVQPLAAHVARELARDGVHPFYAGAGAALAEAAGLCAGLLE